MTPSTFDRLQASTADQIRHRVWIMSDLQQSDLAIARECLSAACEDFRSLEMECDQIWYLGDSVQGSDEDVLRQMAEMQIELLQPFGIPLIYTTGNHEFESYSDMQDGEDLRILPRELFAQVPGWRTSENLSDFYFTDKLGEYTLFFFPDHAHPQGTWLATVGKVWGDKNSYPHTAEAYEAVREQIRSVPGPVITAGHNSFPGGLRASELMGQMLPLPDNVRAHFYGHCHIGDAHWGGPSCFRKLSTVDSQSIPQIDVAALEDRRGDAVRSTILEIYEDETFGVLLREHCQHRWGEAYYLGAKRNHNES